MNKKFTLAAIVAIGIAGVFFLVTQNDPATQPTVSTPTPESNPAGETTGAQTPTPNLATGAYTTYKPGILENRTGTKVLFFHAPWCPQCRALDASIKSGTIPANVTIIKVDHDSNQALRRTYGVTLQTTLVRVDDSGKLVKKYVAYENPTLVALIENVLK